MAAPPSRGAQDVPKIQRLLDNIRFLLAIGVVLPTASYTVWSVYELIHLPTFEMSTVAGGHAGAHGAAAAPAAASAPAAEAPAGTVVRMKNMAYAPREIRIAAGETVTWVNDDPFPHAVASGTPDTPEAERAFAGSGDFGQGESFSVTFDEPGEYAIYCSTSGHYQAGMIMTVIVEEPR